MCIKCVMSENSSVNHENHKHKSHKKKDSYDDDTTSVDSRDTRDSYKHKHKESKHKKYECKYECKKECKKEDCDDRCKCLMSIDDSVKSIQVNVNRLLKEALINEINTINQLRSTLPDSEFINGLVQGSLTNIQNIGATINNNLVSYVQLLNKSCAEANSAMNCGACPKKKEVDQCGKCKTCFCYDELNEQFNKVIDIIAYDIEFLVKVIENVTGIVANDLGITLNTGSLILTDIQSITASLITLVSSLSARLTSNTDAAISSFIIKLSQPECPKEECDKKCRQCFSVKEIVCFSQELSKKIDAIRQKMVSLTIELGTASATASVDIIAIIQNLTNALSALNASLVIALNTLNNIVLNNFQKLCDDKN